MHASVCVCVCVCFLNIVILCFEQIQYWNDNKKADYLQGDILSTADGCMYLPPSLHSLTEPIIPGGGHCHISSSQALFTWSANCTDTGISREEGWTSRVGVKDHWQSSIVYDITTCFVMATIKLGQPLQTVSFTGYNQLHIHMTIYSKTSINGPHKFIGLITYS